jgi:hypothetical protein
MGDEARTSGGRVRKRSRQLRMMAGKDREEARTSGGRVRKRKQA